MKMKMCERSAANTFLEEAKTPTNEEITLPEANIKLLKLNGKFVQTIFSVRPT